MNCRSEGNQHGVEVGMICGLEAGSRQARRGGCHPWLLHSSSVCRLEGRACYPSRFVP